MKYRKKPIVIEAVQWTGSNEKECMEFCPSIYQETYKADGFLTIPTLEGKMACATGDFIIRGVKGEFYPCKPDIFEATYEQIPEPPTENEATLPPWTVKPELGGAPIRPDQGHPSIAKES